MHIYQGQEKHQNICAKTLVNLIAATLLFTVYPLHLFKVLLVFRRCQLGLTQGQANLNINN